MIDQPLWETWTNRLPTRPLCCDVFADGVFRRPRAEALARQHLQFNTDTSLGWLVFDVDHEDFFEAWDRANLHPPNLYAQNPANGNSHLLYALATPVGICDSHRRAPIELAAAVQRGMTRRLRADPCYANRLAKNPQHPRWRTSWLIGEPFDLKKLLEPLDREDTRPFAQRSEIAGISRNCDLFDALRGFAYANVLAFQETGNLNAWVRCLLEEARAIAFYFRSASARCARSRGRSASGRGRSSVERDLRTFRRRARVAVALFWLKQHPIQSQPQLTNWRVGPRPWPSPRG